MLTLKPISCLDKASLYLKCATSSLSYDPKLIEIIINNLKACKSLKYISDKLNALNFKTTRNQSITPTYVFRVKQDLSRIQS